MIATRSWTLVWTNAFVSAIIKLAYLAHKMSSNVFKPKNSFRDPDSFLYENSKLKMESYIKYLFLRKKNFKSAAAYYNV